MFMKTKNSKQSALLFKKRQKKYKALNAGVTFRMKIASHFQIRNSTQCSLDHKYESRP